MQGKQINEIKKLEKKTTPLTMAFSAAGLNDNCAKKDSMNLAFTISYHLLF